MLANNFYDWGDDPSFFMSKQLFGNFNHVTWGVCRRNVRIQLSEGDVVIFFCGKADKRFWNYYFIGYGTVQCALANRQQIWTEEAYKSYRKYYNVLVNINGNHYEPFGEPHDDWKKRIQASYIIFNPLCRSGVCIIS